MFSRLKSGVEVVGDNIKVFRLHPKLSVPLLFCWLIYAPIALYLKFFFPWDNFGFGGICFIVFLIILLFSFIFSCSCLVLLELLQQIESGKRASLFSAFADGLSQHGIGYDSACIDDACGLYYWRSRAPQREMSVFSNENGTYGLYAHLTNLSIGK
ncbi:MAG: hypothetical protein H8E44_41570 [Planctomycetes bacterium]|nr:hypothetical protein [Planctomycetota bacterium]